MMTDDVGPSWKMDVEMRTAMRLRAIHQAAERLDWHATLVEAEELLDEQPNHIEALRWVADAMLALEDPNGARLVYRDLLGRGDMSHEVHAGLALASFELCDFATSIQHARIATRDSPDQPESWYTLSLALEWEAGSSGESVMALLTANRLAPEDFPVPIELSTDDWRLAIEQAMHEVDHAIGQLWSGVPIRLEPVPSREELESANGQIPPTVGGMVVGDRDYNDPDQKPDSLRIFVHNLGRAGSYEAIVGEVMNTLEDEAEAWWGDSPPLEEPYGEA